MIIDNILKKIKKEKKISKISIVGLSLVTICMLILFILLLQKYPLAAYSYLFASFVSAMYSCLELKSLKEWVKMEGVVIPLKLNERN